MRRWLQRLRATQRGEASGPPPAVSGLIDFLTAEISASPMPLPVSEHLAGFSGLGVEEQQQQLAGTYLFLEQFLTEVDPAGKWTRQDLRATVAAEFTELVALPDLRPVFGPRSEQRAQLSAYFLLEVSDRLRHLLGARCDDLLSNLPEWLQTVPESPKLPIPLAPMMQRPPGNAGEWSQLFRLLSRRVYGRASGQLGGEVTHRLFESAYSTTSKRYRGLESFPEVVNLLPDELLDEEKIALLSRSQVQAVLLDKLDNLQTVNEELSERARQLAETEIELTAAQEELMIRVEERTFDLSEANEVLKQEVSERNLAERALRDSETRFRSVVESAPDAIVVLDQDGAIRFWNEMASTTFGYSHDEVVGKPVSMLVAARAGELFVENLLNPTALRLRTRRPVEFTAIRKGGTEFPVEVSHTSWETEGRRQYCSIVRDISERVRSQERLQVLADRDPLTSLFNRRRFREELERELAQAARYGSPGALLFLDIDEFKDVNDTLGHGAGDQMICSLARLIGERLRTGDLLGRLGGDEFAVYLPQTEAAGATSVASQLLKAARHHTVPAEPLPFGCTISIGITLFPDHGTTSDDLIKNADLAMYEAKELGRNCYRMFASDNPRRELIGSRLLWEQRIRDTLANDGFVLHFQPLLDLRTDEIKHYELLLRMTEDDGTLIPPGTFLGIAERYGMIQLIDQWVVRQAIALIAAGDLVPDSHDLAINLSARALSDPNLLSAISDELDRTGIDPSRITFEITESAAIADLHLALNFVQSLKREGCRFALDDFGIGFSSFNSLKHLPVDDLKIDGTFIVDLPRSPIDQQIVQAIVAVAQSLGQRTIAEYVTDEETLELLRGYGVDLAQGFFIGKPGPLEEVAERTAG